MFAARGEEVLYAKYSGGPMGLGDPDDRSLRKVEKEIMIPKKMRELARNEMCVPEVAEFNECCKNSSLLSLVTCQKQNKAMKECLGKWYTDEGFKSRCTDEYLAERSQYRKTGINKNRKTVRVGNAPSSKESENV